MLASGKCRRQLIFMPLLIMGSYAFIGQLKY